jgi:hypothetical protein
MLKFSFYSASGDFWGEKDIPISKNNRESIAYLVR